jgi:phosphodiesterase/alkaline phosphatase D-like protein
VRTRGRRILDYVPAIRGDGTTQRVRFSVARSNITPGDHVFHARVTPSPAVKGDVPVLVEVDGDPSQPESERIRRIVFSRYVPPERRR